MQLTARQHELVSYVWSFTRTRGLSPTLGEIGAALGISRVTVHEHLKQLQVKGAVDKARFVSRSVRLTPAMRAALEEAQPWSRRPVSGELRPGRGLTPADRAADPVDLTQVLQLGRARSLVRVRGDAAPGWRDGDLLLLAEGQRPRAGQTVLAVLAGGEAVIGRLKGRGRRLEVVPERGGPPVRAAEVELRGVVVGGIRAVG